jgi:exopolyphosphatase/guanosine-5'-triphosphate,3'-diphosphate pyrophosphatase
VAVRGTGPAPRSARYALELEVRGRISAETAAATADAVRRLVSHPRAHRAASVDVLVAAPGRQAENGAELSAAIEQAIGLPVRILSAEEEARLAFAGAVTVAEPTADVVAVVDVGGASTELAVGSPAEGPSWLRSVDLGVLRLTARLLEMEEPDRYEVEAARFVVAEAFAGIAPPLPGAALAVGGSARALRRIFGPRLGHGELVAASSLLPMCSCVDLVACRCRGLGGWRVVVNARPPRR